MKTFLTVAVAVLIPVAGWADAISSPGAGLVAVPPSFQSTTGSNGGQGVPFWNNNSVDGVNMNVGNFLTGSNPAMGSTNYLGAGSFGNYLSTGGSGPDAPGFTFLQSGTTLEAMLLYSNASSNYSYGSYGITGTQIGLYNVADPSVNETLFAAGTLYNLGTPDGVYNNNISPQAPIVVGSWANYGIYAYTCGFNQDGSTYCNMYYSNPALNQSSDPNHQHFALFQDPQNPQTYFIGFEANRGLNATEGYGDYNDVIFRLVTDDPPGDGPQILSFAESLTETPNPVPEPATLSIMGLGLVGLGLIGRRRLKK